MEIWKFPFVVRDTVQIVMPEGAEIMKLGRISSGRLAIWALVDTEAKRAIVNLRVIGTGHRIHGLDMLDYIDTAFDRPFVWHVFRDASQEVA